MFFLMTFAWSFKIDHFKEPIFSLFLAIVYAYFSLIFAFIFSVLSFPFSFDLFYCFS